MYKLTGLVTGSLLLAGCGGGGGSLQMPPPTSGSTDPFTLYAQQEIVEGQTLGLAAVFNRGLEGSDFSWQQLSGPVQLEFLAGNSKVVSADVDIAGNYTFRFSSQINGTLQSADISVNVQASSSPAAQLRLDHTAVEQLPASNASRTGKQTVSLRVDGDLAISNVSWQQVSGPAVTTTTNGQYLFFTAPSVSRDTLLEFKATVTFSSGQTATEQAFVLIDDTPINSTDGYFPVYAEQVMSSDIHPYRADSPYADVLVDCVVSNTLNNTCRFSTLPLLAMDSETPTVDDVMNRVVVSHDWMGQRFEEYLRNSAAGSDVMRLLRATTAVVISYDVTPAFFWSATGAIYLDPVYLWQTPQERDTLLDAPDYRAAFGDALQFDMYTTYTQNDEFFFKGYSASQRQSRPFEEMAKDISRLLFHELAHANDYISPARWASLSTTSDPFSASRSNRINQTLESSYPLTSVEMQALADVRFGTGAGQTPNYTATQLSYTAADIGGFFAPDSGVDFYNYSAIAEDLAMYFQHMLMVKTFGVDTVTVIWDQDTNITGWAEKNRIGKDALQGKAAFILESIIPELDGSATVAAFSDNQAIAAGEDYLCTFAPADPRCTASGKTTQPWLPQEFTQRLQAHGTAKLPLQ